ncbi:MULTISPECIES: Glu/Leu/Phe/Val dehydrogenase [unclassified Iodidimonas]|jgi:leucine dehydrogenase|uniref:Glu/Leu/Phe/Val family dehydrogenase n=1 Tax=unclassified Iodidimonas TaxID=2626145 RepID=UPI0024822EA6|nr:MULTISPECIES: Glu/Leu/Phe/Val dehydrogenase [unclassified Iodidimonas]
MPVFSTRAFNKHEQVVFCSDPVTGLQAIIAIHSTVLGPAVGGCRFWDYAAAHRGASLEVAQKRAEEDAVFDVLRLSRGMSYKNAMAGLRIGGGKSVIIGDPKSIKTPELLRKFGEHLTRLGGRYYTAEDVGTKPQDMEIIHQTSNYVVGLESGDFATGDPSPHTALGVFAGIEAAAKYKLGRKDLKGLSVAIQGVGNVGRDLAMHLREAGAKIIIADIVKENIERVLAAGQAEVVDVQKIHAVDADIFAPCALGGVLNAKTIPQINAKIIAGAANNVLDDEVADDIALQKRGILYAPDYIINAGGIISVESEVYQEHLDHHERSKKIARIAETLIEVFETSDQKQQPTGRIANELAEQRIDAKRQSLKDAAE